LQRPHGEVDLQCALKAIGDAARITIVVNLMARVAGILRKRIKRSKSEEP
jgi:hypothetical protein